MAEPQNGSYSTATYYQATHPQSSRGCLGRGAACIFGSIQQPRMPAYWILGERQALWAAFCKKDQLLRHRGLRIKAFGVVLHSHSRARGLRDAEYSGICTPPPGVPAGKKQPPRRNMQSAGRFMQISGCGRIGSSLQFESRDRLLGTLEGADHVDLVEGTIGGEVDDKRKAKGKHHGKHIAQRLDLNVKVQRWHLQDVGKALGQQAA